jgi:hypothetical protein
MPKDDFLRVRPALGAFRAGKRSPGAGGLNPQSHQWSQNFINSKMGLLTTPLIGAFKDGIGELYGQDTFGDGDRSILVQGFWSDITVNSHRYEESYSEDGGKTWKVAFIANLTRVPIP